MTRTPGQLGRLPGGPYSNLHLENFTSATPTTPPPAYDDTKGWPFPDPLGNNNKGDCFEAALEHARELQAILTYDGTPTWVSGFRQPHAAYTLDLYDEYVTSAGYPAGSDPGTSSLAFLQFLYAKFNAAGREFAFAAINMAPGLVNGLTTRQRLQRAIIDFRGAIVGVDLTPNYAPLFTRGIPWRITPTQQPDPNLGHAMAAISYDEQTLEFATWGYRQRATWEWVDACSVNDTPVYDSWVFMDRTLAARAGVDFEALCTEIESMPFYDGSNAAATMSSARGNVMFDAVNVEHLPRDATHVAGYVDGQWPTYHELLVKFPHARVTSIATSHESIADVLDVEHLDATLHQAPGWVKRMRQRGRRPIIYTSRSKLPALRARFASTRVPMPFLWVADWTGRPHLVPGSIATQWANGSTGYPGLMRYCDTSLVAADFPDPLQHPTAVPNQKGSTVSLPFSLNQLKRFIAVVGSYYMIVASYVDWNHLPTAYRAVFTSVGGVILAVEHVTGQTPNVTPPPAAKQPTP